MKKHNPNGGGARRKPLRNHGRNKPRERQPKPVVRRGPYFPRRYELDSVLRSVDRLFSDPIAPVQIIVDPSLPRKRPR